MHQVTVDLMPDGHPEKVSKLEHLAAALQARFQRLGDINDLDRAISWQQAALERTPDGHPSKVTLLRKFGAALAMRFERVGNPGDRDGGAELQGRTVELGSD